MSRASRGFPKKIGLSMNRKLGIFIKEIGGALDEEDYEPEYELLEDIDMSEETSKPLPPELQPVLMDDGLPWGNSEDAIMDDDSDCDASDYQNTEDWDPGQDTTDYGPSSDEALEPCNAFGLGEASDLTLTPLPGHLNPKGDDAIDGTIQFFEQVDSSESRRNPSTGDRTYFADSALAPYLLIYSFATPASASQDPNAAFQAMVARYAYMTIVDEYRGFTAYKHRSNESRWLLVQEFDHIWNSQSYLALKKKQAKHWLWKNEWIHIGLAFYSVDGHVQSE